jgi:hypothetical protein
MTIAELIAELAPVPAEAEVRVWVEESLLLRDRRRPCCVSPLRHPASERSLLIRRSTTVSSPLSVTLDPSTHQQWRLCLS